ncbi:Calcium/calmodulin-dependent protein kinase kinase 2 isoform A [Sphaceloma murrayae]|uniref:Calcium/calmodulin-dependent protein kinase kinase 2 isoform A n=1 Tax=Sphaceloma murrayae TaxID=2082308 RepID=A0A2K1QPS5_9PEZI|nr:Calcium/calmodulin-dependent protein kinase kinase 2 isoform A [Sphaceloma murrayae]
MADPSTSRTSSAAEDKLQGTGIIPSHGISLDAPAVSPSSGRPLAVSHVSAPAYHSPLRHHRRESSRTKEVKETANAKSHYGSSEDDGGTVHRINQYSIKQEIGRGSFGSVHLAVDQYGQEYAVKEFSKSRLRKRAQSNLLRRPSKKKGSGIMSASSGGFNSPLHRHQSGDKLDSETDNAFDLIKGEIAIMKKLDHPNLVGLIEVLDDPEEDSLYMVLEMCKKGVVMKVGLDEVADPYDDDTCRYWFRDMFLGLEYLHAQGIIHRDLKPDNCLITQDDVLKIVDFGVSEMFDKESEMHTSKHAGSPAFMPPELCVAKHGHVSGRAVDVWSMGVTLHCLRYGRIPFEEQGMLQLFDAIREKEIKLEGEQDDRFKDLILRMLEKDPKKRIAMSEIRDHPWVTKDGQDPLLSEEENCNNIVDDPTEEEVNHAITGKMGHLMAVAKAVKRFKNLLFHGRPELMEGILGRSSRIVAPPAQMRADYGIRQSQSLSIHNRRPVETALSAEGIHHDLHVTSSGRVVPKQTDSPSGSGRPSDGTPEPISRSSTGLERMSSGTPASGTSSPAPRGRRTDSSRNFSPDDTGRGHAHDPLLDTLYLKIGAGPDLTMLDEAQAPMTVCESPPGVEENIYEKAYEEEMERILAARGRAATIFLTRRVEHKESFRTREGVVGSIRAATTGGLAAKLGGGSKGGLAGLVKRAKAEASKEGATEQSTGECETDKGNEDKVVAKGSMA